MAKSVKGRIQVFFATSSLLLGKSSGVYIFYYILHFLDNLANLFLL